MLFFEAFDKITVDDRLEKLFKEVDVIKVVVSKEKKTALIHTVSNHIIQTADIRKMENLLNQQIFFHTDNRAIIKAKFKLSAQYDLSNLYPIYRESLL